MIPEVFDPTNLRENLAEVIPVAEVVNIANGVMAELAECEHCDSETLTFALGVMVGRIMAQVEARRAQTTKGAC
jgi:hypothetical protein